MPDKQNVRLFLNGLDPAAHGLKAPEAGKWFVDGSGNALAEPIVGLPTIDFYGAYLDQRIADSLAKLQSNP